MKFTAALLVLGLSATLAAQGPPPPPPPPPPSPQNAPARDMPFLPPTGGGSIAGVVVTTDERPVPVRSAIVTLRGDGFRTGWTYVTDNTGTFTFTALPAGRFTLAVTRAGFPSLIYGALRPGRPGASIVLKDNAKVEHLTIAMPRGAVISGRVTDDVGAPLSGIPVSAGTIVTRNGDRTMRFGGNDITDDLGNYRIYGLPAGDYTVSITVRTFERQGSVRYASADIDAFLRGQTEAAQPGRATAAIPAGQEMALLSTTYYPSVGSIDEAGLVHVEAGEERNSVDVRAGYLPAATISGVLLDPDGRAPKNVIMNLVQIGVRGPAVFGRPSPVDGAFSFAGVAPGQYAVTARATSSPDAAGAGMPPLWARADVAVNGLNVSGIRVQLQPGANLTGAVAFETTGQRPPPASVRVGLTPVLSAGDIAIGVTATTMDRDRGFAFAGVPPGRYRLDPQTLTAGLSPAWMLKSAMLNGQDVLDQPFQVSGADLSGLTVTFTDKVTSITGSLEDATGRPAPDYYVIVFPTDQAHWFQGSRRIKAVRPTLEGGYIIRGLPPGTYRIGAVTDVDANEWFEPSFLQQLLPASAELVLADGEVHPFSLKIGG
jgi:uncharacterized protein (DUF2141 family)